MDKQATRTWNPDKEVKVSPDNVITSMVIYAECDELIGYDAHSYEQDTTEGTIHIAIGRTKIIVTDNAAKDTKSLTINPFKVEYEKEIYRPGMVKILTHVTGGNHLQYAKNLDRLFLDSECRMNLVTWHPENQKYISVARSYYLDHLSIDRDADNAVVATLVCYSPDHKMTLDKFCQAYTGQRFATQILTNGIARFTNTAKLSLDKRDLMFLTYDSDNFDVRALCGNPPGCMESSREEMIQAYLLQYNESFYDFICRIANRCGEFLYFEDGKLHLGLPEDTRRIMEKSGTMTMLRPYNVSYPKIKSKVSSGLKTGTFLYDPVSKTNMAPEAGTCYMAAHNAPNNTTYKDFKIPDIDIFKDGRFVVGILSAFAAGGDAGVAIASAMFNAALAFVNNKTDKYEMSTRYWQLFFYNMLTGLKPVNGVPAPPPLNSDAVALVNNLSQEFYSQIRKLEEDVTDEIIMMDFENVMPDVSLASAVTIDDEFAKGYIVTKMSGEFMQGDQKHTLSAVPRVSATDSHWTGTPIKTRLSRKTDEDKALLVPPLLKTESNSAIAPMEAVVQDAKDPFRLGRVRVSFLWQSEEDYNLTDWIPMSTPFAGQKGNGGGIFMMPEAGTHVIVNFFDNDIHHPYVSGSLYNSEQEAPGYGAEYASLPKMPQPYSPYNQVMTIQSANGHGITFADDPDIDMLSDVLCPTAGAIVKSIRLANDKDKNAPSTFKFTKNWGQAKGGGITIADRSGFYNISMSSTKREIDISCPLGQVKMDAFTGITISAPNGDINIEGKNVSISAGNNLTIQSGTNVKTEGTKLAAVGSSFITTLLASGFGYGAAIAVAKATMEGVTLDKFCDFHFLRSSWEVLMRPVEGTLSLSTVRNITMTAGLGQAVVPAKLQSNVRTGPFYLKTYQQRLHDTDDMAVLISVVEKNKKLVSEFYEKRSVAVKVIQDGIVSLQTSLNQLPPETFNSGDTAIQKFFENKKCHNKEKLYECIKSMDKNAKSEKAEIAACLQSALVIKAGIESLQDKFSVKAFAENITKGIKSIKALTISESDLGSSLWPVGMDDKLFNNDNLCDVNESVFTEKLKVTQRKAIIAVIKQSELFNDLEEVDVTKDIDWFRFIQKLPKLQKAPSIIKESLKGGGMFLGNIVGRTLNMDSVLDLLNVPTIAQQAMNFNGKQGPYAFADISSGGSILMSNHAGFTHRLSDDGKAMELDNNSMMESLQNAMK